MPGRQGEATKEPPSPPLPPPLPHPPASSLRRNRFPRPPLRKPSLPEPVAAAIHFPKPFGRSSAITIERTPQGCRAALPISTSAPRPPWP
ncbi:hypothetical protein ACP70R_018550 [Stipagrostis hirtigluma subsp. patula]